MQTIRAGDQAIEVIGIRSESTVHNYAYVEALKVSFPADVTEEQLEALTSLPWEIYGEDGVLQGVQSGITHIKEYVVTFLKVPEAAVLQARLDAVSKEAAALRHLIAKANISDLQVNQQENDVRLTPGDL